MTDLQLAIFDCDGVLVDSEAISNTILLLADIVVQAQGRLGHRLPEDWLERYERIRADAFRRELQPIAGAAEAVQRVCNSGMAVCVASQGKLEKTRLSLQLTGLDRLFAEPARFSAWSVARGKPHPDLFLHAASTMGASPESCVVIEDTASGVTAAVRAGMRAIGYAGNGDEDALRTAGAECIHTMDELPQLLRPE
jgi:HAD superfamily hydrolase (TIGR01509 family)